MTQTIALAGKGGVGKTTISGMLIEYLAAKKNGPVLAVDADANSNLNEVLGLPVYTTLGDIREEMEAEGSKSTIPAGMTKAEYADAKFAADSFGAARAGLVEPIFSRYVVGDEFVGKKSCRVE